MLRNGCTVLAQFELPAEKVLIESSFANVATVLLRMMRNNLTISVLKLGIILLNNIAAHIENENRAVLGEMKTVETVVNIIGTYLYG